MTSKRNPDPLDHAVIDMDSLSPKLRAVVTEHLEEKADRLVELLRRTPGAKPHEYAEKVGLSPRDANVLVHGRVSLHGSAVNQSARPQPRIRPEVKEAVVKMHSAGLTADAIELQIGRSRKAIYRILREAGKGLRPRGRPRRRT